MKKIILSSLVFCSMATFAQKTSLSIPKGKVITATSVTTTDMDMGMGTMKTEATSTSTIEVAEETNDSYKLISKLTKAKISVDGMGQNMSYDSENAADKDSQLGAAIGDKLNKAETVMLDKKTFKTIADANAKKEDAGGMGIGDPSQTVEAAFLAIPADIETGKSWKTSSTDKGITTNSSYTLKSVDKEMATISVETTMQGTTEKEVQGQTMNMTMDNKLKGEMQVNIKTGMVSKSTIDGDINSTIDMMGQQMPITSKTKSTISFSF